MLDIEVGANGGSADDNDDDGFDWKCPKLFDVVISDTWHGSRFIYFDFHRVAAGREQIRQKDTEKPNVDGEWIGEKTDRNQCQYVWNTFICWAENRQHSGNWQNGHNRPNHEWNGHDVRTCSNDDVVPEVDHGIGIVRLQPDEMSCIEWIVLFDADACADVLDVEAVVVVVVVVVVGYFVVNDDDADDDDADNGRGSSGMDCTVGEDELLLVVRFVDAWWYGSKPLILLQFWLLVLLLLEWRWCDDDDVELPELISSLFIANADEIGGT